MRLVLSTVKDITSNQESMRRSFDFKLDKMRNEFMATLDEKVNTFRGDIAMDISKESGRSTSWKSVYSRCNRGLTLWNPHHQRHQP